MFFTNFSLTYISYPTQALAKSCKILPTMLGGLFVKNLKYHPLQYLSVGLITVGTMIFNYDSRKPGNDSTIGIALLLGSLVLDSLTSYYSEHIRRNYSTSSLQTMKYLCGWGSLLLVPVIILLGMFSRNENLIQYLIKYPSVLDDIARFGLMSATGQIFIFWALKDFGTLTLSIITTTRKFLTVIVSVTLFSHNITQKQVLCIALVFFGVLVDLFVSNRSKTKKVS
jgi:solute carrier family 35 (UDP-galactose transporter), member B1